MITHCTECRKELKRPPSRIKNVKVPFCSRICLKKYKSARSTRRYSRIYINGKYIDEHRWVASQKLGRELLKNEVVHHVDGNKKNNMPDNIEVFPAHSAHAKFHKPFKVDPIEGIKLRNSGLSLRQIAERFACTEASVLRALVSTGQYKKGEIHRPITWDTSLAIKMRSDGKTFAQIAEAVGRCDSLVHYYLTNKVAT